MGKLFGPRSKIIELKRENFNESTGKFNHPKLKHTSFVLFAADWCGYCVRFAPIIKSVSNVFGDSFQIFVVDCTNDTYISTKVKGVQGFPTLMFMSGDGRVYKSYQGERTVDALLKAVCDETMKCFKN